MWDSHFHDNIIYKGNNGYSYTKYKLKYDNNIIKRKMNEIKNKTGPYNNMELIKLNNDRKIPKSNYKKIKKIENDEKIEKDKKFNKRIKSAKTCYSLKKIQKSNIRLNNYKNFMLKILRKNRDQPFIYQEMENILNKNKFN